MDNNYPSEKRDFNDNAAPQPQLFTTSQNQLYMNNNQNQENIYSKPIYPAKIQPNSNINQNQVNAYSKPICQPEGAQISQQYQQQNAIIVNQPRPIQGAVIIRNINFGTRPISTICPFCGACVTSVVEKSFNFCSCLLCLYTGALIYACIKAIIGKELFCYDAVHRCPNCGAILGNYKDLC